MFWIAFTFLFLLCFGLAFVKVDRWSGLLPPFRTIILIQSLLLFPYLIFWKLGLSGLHPDIQRAPNIMFSEDAAFVKYMIVQALSFVAMFVGYISKKEHVISEGRGRPFFGDNLNSLLVFSLIFAIGAFAIKIQMVGGITNTLFYQLEDRVELQKGTGYISFVYEVGFYLASFVCMKKLHDIPTIKNKIIALIIILVASVAFSSFGGRKNTVFLIMSLLLYWNFSIQPIKRLRLYLIFVPVLLVSYSAIVLSIRDNGGASNKMVVNEQNHSVNPLVAILSNLSYVPQYVYIINCYSTDDYWLGRSFNDLAVAFLPSSLYPDKPPVDDGVYIRNHALGARFVPSTPAKKMELTGWPPQTIGIGWINFGVFGVIFLSFIYGYLQKIFVSLAIQSRNIGVIFVAVYSILNFQISVLRIVQLISITSVAYSISFIAGKAKFIFTQRNR